MSTLRNFVEAQLLRLEALMIADLEHRILEKRLDREVRARAKRALVDDLLALFAVVARVVLRRAAGAPVNDGLLAEEQIGMLLESLRDEQIQALVAQFDEAQRTCFFDLYKVYKARKHENDDEPAEPEPRPTQDASTASATQ